MSGAAASCHEDWIALARRGALREPEWEALEGHLRLCPDCRADELLARAFEGSAGVEPEDEALVARVLDAAVGGAARPRPLARRAPRAAVSAAASVVLAVAAMASAGIALHRHLMGSAAHDVVGTPPATATSLPPLSAAPGPTATSRGVPALASSRVAVPNWARARATATAPAPQAKRTRRSGVAAAGADAPGAPHRSPQAALFARATEARSAGRPGEAIVLFRQLERDWPASAEATVSLVSLGNLLAEMGQADEALASLDSYLRKNSSGPLAEEALVGRARLLDRMGRGDEARAARQELRSRFPRSAYGLEAERGGAGR